MSSSKEKEITTIESSHPTSTVLDFTELRKSYEEAQSEIKKLKSEKEELNSKKNKSFLQGIFESFGNLFNLENSFALVCLFTISLILLLSSIVIPKLLNGYIVDSIIHIIKLFLTELGVLTGAIFTATLIYERLLRKKVLKETQTALKKQLIELVYKTLPDKLDEIVKKQLPEKYQHIQDSGIVDVYSDLNLENIEGKIKKLSKGSEFFVLKIWLYSINKSHEAIINAVKRGCKFRIILLHPDEANAIEKRTKYLIFDKFDINNDIKNSISMCKKISEKLRPAEKNLFQVKFHKDFVSIPIVGYDDNILVGFYFHDAISENSFQLKINGRYTDFYKKFKDHFEIQWSSKENETLEDFLVKYPNYLEEN